MTADKKLYALVALNLFLTIALTGWLGHTLHQVAPLPTPSSTFAPMTKYTLYVGTNDKDTLRPAMPTDKARSILDAICLKHTDGFTVVNAAGGWRNAEGAVTHEVTLAYTLVGIGEREVAAMVEEMRTALRQESILVEKSVTLAYFQSGSG